MSFDFNCVAIVSYLVFSTVNIFDNFINVHNFY